MQNFRFIPRLEVKSKNLIKGMRMEGLRIVGDPVEAAYNYYKQSADEIIYEDIVASLYSRLYDLDLISEIANNIHIPFNVSGGIKNIDDIHNILNAGADKVCINTNAVINPKLIYNAAKIFGSQCISVCIQGKKIFEDYWEPFTESGRNRMFINMFEWIREVQDLGCGEIFFISIDHDGLKKGINKDIIKKIKNMCDVPLLVGGGISGIPDIEYLIHQGVSGSVMSRILHFNLTNISELKVGMKAFKDSIREPL